MSTLAQLRDRVELVLSDTTNTIYSTGAIDEAITQALHEYSRALPYAAEEVITLTEDGRQIDLSLLTLTPQHVTEVWWPYDDTTEEWPPNRVRGFRQWWDAGSLALLLDLEGKGDSQPQSGEKVRIWHTANHTIQDLEAAASTTIPATHESILVQGAAGFAAEFHAADKADNREFNAPSIDKIQKFADRQLSYFRRVLEALGRADARAGLPFGPGWNLDKWDDRAGS